MEKLITVYSTFPDLESAERVAELVLSKKLVACVNLLPEMKSYYCWEGEVRRDAEVVFFAKTLENNFTALEKLLIEHHPYDCPCINSWGVEHFHPPYYEWVKDSLS